MLEQPAQVCVVPAPRAGGAAKFARHRAGEQQPLDDSAQAGVVDLADEVLQEALQLFDRAIRSGKELGRVERSGLEAADVIDLGGQLAPVALDLAACQHGVATFEPQADPVGLAKHAGRQCPGAVAQLHREVGAAVAGRQAVLPHAREAALEPLSRPQLGNRRRLLVG